MQNALVAAGYVTSRVLASPQDLKAGQLDLTLMLGRVGQLRLIDPQGHRATLRNALPLRPGDVLNLRGIEQGLENLKRVPSADADIQITPAEGRDARPGESDLLVRWRQSSPFRLALSLDDAGSKSTGKYMGSATVSYDHWWTLNDLFYVSATRTLGGGYEGKRGSKSHTVHYS
ncbi:POTRA domain-containing protein, partial [Chitinimonas sp. BJB300]|uniref:POTRA domain-containing protein n=1 Tax=Chitinimonas sp. BJB300 TaxID=1559339 RepID=UPI0027E59F06